ncbi:MAG: hypothetical protein QOE31_812 [Solirubrobacteraceae bacterium]|jgi:hypothetical protein|nr:hypothetical protein [Solirubrobacteraceae bacterium]
MQKSWPRVVSRHVISVGLLPGRLTIWPVGLKPPLDLHVIDSASPPSYAVGVLGRKVFANAQPGSFGSGLPSSDVTTT